MYIIIIISFLSHRLHGIVPTRGNTNTYINTHMQRHTCVEKRLKRQHHDCQVGSENLHGVDDDMIVSIF